MQAIGFLSRVTLAGTLLAPCAAYSAHTPLVEQGSGPEDAVPRETAMLIPGHLPASRGPLELPKPLAPSEAVRIREIFALQRRGDIQGAEALTGRLGDQTLLGHILGTRILDTAKRSSLPALLGWLRLYAALPEGAAIRALAVRRAPKDDTVPALPPDTSLGHDDNDGLTFDAAAEPARQALIAHQDASAERMGRAAWMQSGRRVGEPAYVAGLAAWRRGDFVDAAGLFESASTARQAGPALRAAAAFWAARVHQRVGDSGLSLLWLRRAAAEPHALHGMLARRILGIAEPVSSRIGGVLTQADLDALSGFPAGRRAFALLQVGERAEAEAELRCLWPQAQAQPALARALMLVAQAAGLGRLVNDLTAALHLGGMEPPPPRLKPRGGYTLSPSLVYAVTRVESDFAADAVSTAGARGLMQLRPEAAALVAGHGGGALLDPGINLRLGQRFLIYLSRGEQAGDNLLRVLVAYNLGARAAQKLGDGEGDPLMFVETVPADETRHYVQLALTYMGVYAARFGAPCAALDALAAGAWPAFSAEMRH